MEREIESVKKEVEGGRRRLEELTHERDVLQRLKTQAHNATKHQVLLPFRTLDVCGCVGLDVWMCVDVWAWKYGCVWMCGPGRMDVCGCVGLDVWMCVDVWAWMCGCL
jgi:hypothetical protein